MITDATRAHIDAETLAAWADHGLSADAAAAVELHLSQCDRCQEVLAAFVRSAPAAGAGVIPFWARRPVQWSAAGLAAAAALLLFVWTGPPSAVPIPESTVASAPTTQPIPPVPAPPVQSAASPAPELRREKPTSIQDKAAANPALPKVKAGRATGTVIAPMPVAAAPPPPPPAATMPPPVTVSGAAPVVTPVGAARPAAMSESVAMGVFSATAPIIEIVAPEPSPAALRSLAAGAGRGNAARALSQTAGPTRWRIIAGIHVERTLDAGATWTQLPIEPPLKSPLLAGAATSPTICWLVGREGQVLVTIDGQTFRRVSLPETVHLTGVTALDGMRATVTAIDGRKFSTIDGGVTWK